MKKTVLFLTMLLLPQFFILADATVNNKTINLHTESAYIINLDKRPSELQVTNPKILKAEVTTDIFSEESQIVVRTLEEGICYITFKLKTIPHTYKVLIDNSTPVDNSVIEIDKIKEP